MQRNPMLDIQRLDQSIYKIYMLQATRLTHRQNKENNSKPVEKEKNKTEVSNSPQKKEKKADE